MNKAGLAAGAHSPACFWTTLWDCCSSKGSQPGSWRHTSSMMPITSESPCYKVSFILFSSTSCLPWAGLVSTLKVLGAGITYACINNNAPDEVPFSGTALSLSQAVINVGMQRQTLSQTPHFTLILRNKINCTWFYEMEKTPPTLFILAAPRHWNQLFQF